MTTESTLEQLAAEDEAVYDCQNELLHEKKPALIAAARALEGIGPIIKEMRNCANSATYPFQPGWRELTVSDVERWVGQLLTAQAALEALK